MTSRDEDAETGTDGPGLALLAILGTNVHLFEVGRIRLRFEAQTDGLTD